MFLSRYKLRQFGRSPSEDEFFDERPQDESLPTEYGFDDKGRIVVGRGWLENAAYSNIRGENLVWYSQSSLVEFVATAGEQHGDGTRYSDVLSYRYAGDRLVERDRDVHYRIRREISTWRERSWFLYDDDARLIRVVSVMITARGRDRLCPRVQRIAWSQDGQPLLVSSTFGRARLEERDLGDLLSAGLVWDDSNLPRREVIYDARLSRPEPVLPPLPEAYDGLTSGMAAGVRAAVTAAVSAGVIVRPFLMMLSWRTGTTGGLPPSVYLVGDGARVRRRALPELPPELVFPESIELSLVDYLDDETLRRCRQIRQTPTSLVGRRRRSSPTAR